MTAALCNGCEVDTGWVLLGGRQWELSRYSMAVGAGEGWRLFCWLDGCLVGWLTD